MGEFLNPQTTWKITTLKTNMDTRNDGWEKPMLISFQILQQRPFLERWRMPKSWRDLNVLPGLVQTNYSHQVFKNEFAQDLYDETLGFESLLEKWSYLCENAVDNAIHEQHQIDPLSQPLKGLPKRYRGRCINRKKVQVPIQNPVKYSENQDYNPCSMAFSVKAKQKVKQVRRLQNLYRSMNNFYQHNHYPEYDRFLQWRSEWHAILYAKGYGSGWDRWLLAFEPITFVPQILPLLEWLSSAIQITRHDAEAFCQQEQEIKKKQFRLKLQFDRQDNYLKSTYRMLKLSPHPPVTSVETTISTFASLNRSKQGCISLTLDDPNVKFSRDREIRFGDSVCELLEQNDKRVKVLHTAGKVPTRARISQKKFAMNPDEVSSAFEKFWSPFWNRDDLHDLVSDENWETINDIVDNVPEIPPINIVLDDPKIWMQTIAKLKSGKAAGYDGWYTDDLKLLPKTAITHLCKIASRGWQHGFNSDFMQARTILLAKIDKVQHMGHTRPITILGQLYRLMTKIVADQILCQWAYIMPPSISGGLPGRGSRNLMFIHQCKLEHIIQEKSSMAGFVLDLIKAFNCIPRRPLVKMLLNAGVPINILTFWMTSLNRLSRLPQLGSSLGKRVYSTTGVPEGDSLSVCGMIALAYHFHEFLVAKFNRVQVNVYADNWSWVSKSISQNFYTLLQTLIFTSAIRMMIDFAKSWAYAVGKDFKKSLPDLQNLFPDGLTPIIVHDDAKELGVQVKYSRKVTLGPIAEKFEHARKQLCKINWMQTTFCAKADLVRAVWQKIFYGAEGQGIGERHFAKLRRQLSNIFVGNHKQASSWIVCHFLQERVIDPELYAICEVIYQIRQLVEVDRHLVLEVLQTASNHQHHLPKQAWGPASTLAIYAKRMDLTIMENGDIIGECFRSINCLHNSSKDIKRFLYNQWQYKIMREIGHRKGVPQETCFHRGIILKVLKDFDECDLRGLYLNISGGYQSGAAKALCYSESEKCPYCGDVDTKEHRLLQCPHFHTIRLKHSKAVEMLQNPFHNWIWLPLPWYHVEVPFFNLLMTTKKCPTPGTFFQEEFPLQDVYRVFTDGSCIDSTDMDARRAGYSIVLDFSRDDAQRLVHLENFIKNRTIPECFRVHTTAHVTSSQDPARAELSAVVQLLVSLSHERLLGKRLVIYTDSAYVIQMEKNLHAFYFDPKFKSHKVQNVDLIDIFAKHWNPDIHSLVKVKAHEDICLADGVEKSWLKLGNLLADEAAKASLVNEISEIKDLAKNIFSHNQSQRKSLHSVFKYLVDFNKLSQKDAKQREDREIIPSNPDGQNNASQDQQLVNRKMSFTLVAETWKISDPIHIPFAQPTNDLLLCCSWGMEVAFDVYQWAQTIKWPSCKEPLKGDCGITFLELLANFLLVTGKTIPVTIKRLGTRITWAPFNSEQAYIQPQRARSAMAQAVVLDSIIQQLNRIFNMAIFPMPKRIGIKSLSHFGHCTLQKRTGYVCRPELKHTKETIFLVNAFLNDCRDNQNYNLSMRVSSYFKTPPVPICMSLQNPATVITPEQVIYRRNKLYGRRRKGQ